MRDSNDENTQNKLSEPADLKKERGEASAEGLRGAELILLFLMLAAFAGGIGCSFFGLPVVGVFCFLAHGCLALVYITVSQSRMLDGLQAERLRADNALGALARKRDDSARLAELQEEYKSCERRLKAATDSVQELLDEKQALESELARKEDTSFAHLLPEPDESAVLDILAVTRGVIQEMEPFCRRAHVQVHLSSSSESLALKADAGYLRILFRNIIDNAVKYMQHGGSLVITLSLVGSDLFIVLKDNGEGLPAQETAHIFELNYQGSNRVSGNGLGLTQSKAVVEYYGGTIYAKSSPHNGMAIYIQLPAECA